MVREVEKTCKTKKKTCIDVVTSSFCEGLGADISSLGPGASDGGAGGLDNAGEGDGEVFFFDLDGAGAGTSAGIVGELSRVGGEAVAAGGELTGTAAGGEATGDATGAGGGEAGIGGAEVGEDAGALAGGVVVTGDVAGGVVVLVVGA